jgi:hypothetical protein
MNTGYIKITGIINKIEFGTRNSPTTFIIYSPTDRKKYECVMNDRIEIRYDDQISGLFMLVNSKYILASYPYVLIGNSQKKIINALKKAFLEKELDIYYCLRKFFNVLSDDDLSKCISQDAQKYKNFGIINSTAYNNQISGKIKTFLNTWFNANNMRALKLLGFKHNETKGFWESELEIYDRLMKNPYSVPIASNEIRTRILSLDPKRYVHLTEETKIAGLICDDIYTRMNKSSWTGIPENVIRKNFPQIDKYIDILRNEYKVIYDTETKTYYLDYPFRVESGMTEHIVKLMNIPIENRIEDIASRPGANTTPSDDQKTAILLALNSRVSVITGGAGTGKSSTLVHLLHNLDINNIDYAVCAFTGKAVSRIKELIGAIGEKDHWITSYRNSPRTIHRLICDAKKRKAEESLLLKGPVVKCLVIDEASMVSSELMYQFFDVYRDIERVILVGDCNQIQPISWGGFFDQIIASQRFPVYYLNTNYRILNGDSIIKNSNAILKSNAPYVFECNSNFNYSVGSEVNVLSQVEYILSNGITFDDFVIISPMNRNVDSVNRAIQKKLKERNGRILPNVDFYVDTKGEEWVIGDKIIMTKNCADLMLYNGDVGKIEFINLSEMDMRVNFNGNAHNISLRREEYNEDSEELDSKEVSVSCLKLAYALTVNKAQGSEWKYVMVYVPEFPMGSFLNRHLFYTAFNRAKICVWIITTNINTLSNSVVKKATSRCDNMMIRLMNRLPVIEASGLSNNSFDEEFDYYEDDF